MLITRRNAAPEIKAIVRRTNTVLRQANMKFDHAEAASRLRLQQLQPTKH